MTMMSLSEMPLVGSTQAKGDGSNSGRFRKISPARPGVGQRAPGVTNTFV